MRNYPIVTRTHRDGFTLTEVIVTIGIFTLLCAMLMPAIQESRNAARLTQCRVNLRELCIAANVYHDQFQQLPRGDWWPKSLLVCLQQDPIFRLLGSAAQLNSAAQSGVSFKIPIYVCPNESNVPSRRFGDVNYMLNNGSSLRRNGLYSIAGRISWRDVTDGLSQTACFSERQVSLENPVPWAATNSIAANDPVRFIWYPSATFGLGQEDALFVHCQNPANRTSVTPFCADYQRDLALLILGYDHIFPPNVPSCYINPAGTSSLSCTNLFFNTPIPATSYHRDGVMLGFCDGHVRFVNNSVNLTIWRALGSRRGRELVASLSD